MGITNNLKQLKNKEDEYGFVSFYLNTDIGEGGQPSEEWKIKYKKAVNGLKQYADKSETKDEKNAIKKITDDIEKYIEDHRSDLQKSVIIFASGDGSTWEADIFQVPVETEVMWEPTPQTGQLEKLEKTFPPTAILLTNKQDVYLIDTSMGVVREEMQFHWDVDNEDWKEYKGTASADRTAAGSTQVDKVQQRFEENRHRWYKSLAPVINKQMKNRGLDTAYIIGDKEYAKDLEDNMGERVKEVINKNLISTPTPEILNEIYPENVR